MSHQSGLQVSLLVLIHLDPLLIKKWSDKAAICPVCTLVLFLTALDEAGCSFTAPSLPKAGKPRSQWQPGTQGEESSSPKPPHFKCFSSIVTAQSKQYRMVEFTGP